MTKRKSPPTIPFDLSDVARERALDALTSQNFPEAVALIIGDYCAWVVEEWKDKHRPADVFLEYDKIFGIRHYFDDYTDPRLKGRLDMKVLIMADLDDADPPYYEDDKKKMIGHLERLIKMIKRHKLKTGADERDK